MWKTLDSEVLESLPRVSNDFFLFLFTTSTSTPKEQQQKAIASHYLPEPSSSLWNFSSLQISFPRKSNSISRILSTDAESELRS